MRLDLNNCLRGMEARYRLLLAASAGALAALSLAPFSYVFVLLLSFPTLVLLLDIAMDEPTGSWKRVFSTGYCFGFGYFLVGLVWIVYGIADKAVVLDLGKGCFIFLVVCGAIGLPIICSIFTGLGTLIASLWWKPVPTRILALAVGLAFSDYVRGTLGFPWNSFGYGLATNVLFMQPASLFGLYGMSWLAVLVASAPVLFFSRHSGVRTGLSVVFVFIVVCFVSMLYLFLNPVTFAPGVHVQLVNSRFQPGFDMSKSVQRLLSITFGVDGKGLDGVTHVIWPENMVSISRETGPSLFDLLKQRLPDTVRLLTGGVRVSEDDGEERRVFNSFLVIDADGNIEDVYDKSRLVPFGEYLPLREWLSWLGIDKLLFPVKDFSRGNKSKLLLVEGMGHVMPHICYESVFPEARSYDRRPNLIINIANDAFFAGTFGLWQNLQQARFRAVETGLPLLRASNKGISAVVDGNGRLLSTSSLGEEGVLNTKLPIPLARTPYAIVGDYLFFVLIFVSIALVICVRHCRR